MKADLGPGATTKPDREPGRGGTPTEHPGLHVSHLAGIAVIFRPEQRSGGGLGRCAMSVAMLRRCRRGCARHLVDGDRPAGSLPTNWRAGQPGHPAALATPLNRRPRPWSSAGFSMLAFDDRVTMKPSIAGLKSTKVFVRQRIPRFATAGGWTGRRSQLNWRGRGQSADLRHLSDGCI